MNFSTVIEISDLSLHIQTENNYKFWVSKKCIEKFVYIKRLDVTQLFIPSWLMLKLKVSDCMLIVQGNWHEQSFPNQTTLNL